MTLLLGEIVVRLNTCTITSISTILMFLTKGCNLAISHYTYFSITPSEVRLTKLVAVFLCVIGVICLTT